MYTVPVVKFTYVYELLENQKLTIAQLVPSLLNYLQKYFDEIYLPYVKYTFLTAEALRLNLLKIGINVCQTQKSLTLWSS